MQERRIRRAAVIGTGTIGMSWAANFLSQGIEVASDPAPEAEARLRQFIDAAWPVLTRLRPIAATPPHHLLNFCADAEPAVAAADFVSWWDDLGSPRLTPEVRAALAEGVAAEACGRDIAALEAERDRFLLDLLTLKQGTARRAQRRRSRGASSLDHLVGDRVKRLRDRQTDRLRRDHIDD